MRTREEIEKDTLELAGIKVGAGNVAGLLEIEREYSILKLELLLDIRDLLTKVPTPKDIKE